ncbi:MAG: helix-turn-helix domain-containing protein [Bacillota bacterium]
MSEILKMVGENIRYFRKNKGITQEELGEMSDIQYTYIGGIERGERNISLETLEKITNSLGISLSEVFQFKNLNVDEQHFNKHQLIEINRSLLENRSNEEIKLIHKTIKNILELIDNQS